MKINLSKGLSALELLIVVAIIGSIVFVVAPSFISFRKNQSIQNTTNALSALIQEARNKTLSSYNNTFYSIKVESGQAVLFTGGTYSSSDITNKVLIYESPVVLQTLSLNGSGSVISFDRLKGTTSQYGTISLQIPSFVTRTVTVSSSGVITRD